MFNLDRIEEAMKSGVVGFPPGLTGKERKEFIMGHLTTNYRGNFYSREWKDCPFGTTHRSNRRTFHWMKLQGGTWFWFNGEDWVVQMGEVPLSDEIMEPKPDNLMGQLPPPGTQCHVEFMGQIVPCEVVCHFKPTESPDCLVNSAFIIEQDGVKKLAQRHDARFHLIDPETLKREQTIREMIEDVHGVDPLNQWDFLGVLYDAGWRKPEKKSS